MKTTFKYASNLYHVEMEKGRRNTPSFGRAKEVGVGSIFEFAAFLSRNHSLCHVGCVWGSGGAKLL